MPQDPSSMPLQTRPPTRLASTLLANPDADGFTVLAVDDHASPTPRPYSVSVPWDSLFSFLSSKSSRDVLPLSLLAPLLAPIASSNSTHDHDIPASPRQISNNFIRYSSSYTGERFSSPTVMSTKSEPVTTSSSRNDTEFSVSSAAPLSPLSFVDSTDGSNIKNESENASDIRPVKAIPDHLLNRRHTVSSTADNNSTTTASTTSSTNSKTDDNSVTSTPTSATSSTAPNSASKDTTKPSERRRNSHDETYLWDSLYDRLVPIMPNEMSLRVWHPHDKIITFPAASFIEVREKDGSRASPCNLHSNEWIKGQVCGSTCSHRDGFGAKRPILIREHIRKCSSLAPDDPLKVLCVLELAAHNRASRQNRLRLKRRREDFERSTFDLPFNPVNMSPMSYGHHIRQLQHQSSPLQVNGGTPVDGSSMVQFGIPYSNTSPSMLCPPMQHPGVSVLSNSAGVTQQSSANGVPARASSLPLGAEPRYLPSASMPMQINGSQWSTPEQPNPAAAAAVANVTGYPPAPLFPFDANNYTDNRQATPSQEEESAESAREARRHTISTTADNNGFYATYSSYNQMSDDNRASSNPPPHTMVHPGHNEKQSTNDTNSMAYYLAEVDQRQYFATGLGIDFRNDGTNNVNSNAVSASIETSSAPAVSSATASELLPPFASPPPQSQQQSNQSSTAAANFGSRRDLISMASDIKANSPLLVFGDLHASASSSGNIFTSQAMAVAPPISSS